MIALDLLKSGAQLIFIMQLLMSENDFKSKVINKTIKNSIAKDKIYSLISS